MHLLHCTGLETMFLDTFTRTCTIHYLNLTSPIAYQFGVAPLSTKLPDYGFHKNTVSGCYLAIRKPSLRNIELQPERVLIQTNFLMKNFIRKSTQSHSSKNTVYWLFETSTHITHWWRYLKYLSYVVQYAFTATSIYPTENKLWSYQAPPLQISSLDQVIYGTQLLQNLS